jgi:hypothetical protein
MKQGEMGKRRLFSGKEQIPSTLNGRIWSNPSQVADLFSSHFYEFPSAYSSYLHEVTKQIPVT